MNEYSAFPLAPTLQDPHHQSVSCHIQDTRWGGGLTPSLDMQSVYSTAPVDWANAVRDSVIITHYKYNEIILENKKNVFDYR